MKSEYFVIYATHQCGIHDKCVHRLVIDELRYEISLENLREKIYSVFQLPPSALFELKYSDGTSEDISIVTYEELWDALVRQKFNPLGLKVVHKCSSPFVRVLYKDIYHLLTLPPGELEFCHEELHGRVRNQFHLPPSANFVFSYKEPGFSGPLMTVESGDELKYPLHKEAPNHLQLEITLLEGNKITLSAGNKILRKSHMTS